VHFPASGAARQSRGVQTAPPVRPLRFSVLIVVKTGNVQPFLQTLLDFKTARRGNVFQVDAANPTERLATVLMISSVACGAQASVGVNTGNSLNKHGLALHAGIAASGPILPKGPGLPNRR